MDSPDFSEVLLRISISEGTVAQVVSTSSDEDGQGPPDIEGGDPSELFETWPLSSSFGMNRFTDGTRSLPCAARMDSDSSILVYFIDSDDYGLANPSAPAIRILPDRHLPLVSPGFVCLLGYTPWELSQSELLSSLPSITNGSSGQVTLIDRNGKACRLVFSRIGSAGGGCDYIFMKQPDDLVFPVKELERLAQMDVQTPDDLLAFIVDAAELEEAVLLCRATSGYVPVSAVNVEVDSEHFETSSILDPDNLSFPIWVDLEEEGSPFSFRGQCLVYPSGGLVLVAPWRGDADTLQRRVDCLMPAVSMKYGQYSATHGEHRMQNLFHELDMILAGGQGHGTIQKALETAAAGFSATVLAIFGPEESASPVVMSNVDRETRELLLSDRPFEECFDDTHVTMLSDGYSLLAAWNEPREVSYSLVDVLGRKLRKHDLDRMRADKVEMPDFSPLQAVFMKDTKVVWQGRSIGISNCYQFYGNSRQCIDCPVVHLVSSGRKSARLENHHGFIEEIFPAGNGFLVTWTRLPAEKGADRPEREAFPGGEAEYSADGRIISWGGWFQEAAGAGIDQISGQNAARILNRIGAPAVLSQYRAALAGSFIPEPVEFVWKGMKCYSRMRRHRTGDSIVHTVLDSNRAGISDATTLGPGIIAVSGEPGSLAEFLSTACRREGWEFDISGTTSEEGAPVWFSRRATTDLLTCLLHLLAPMCPDRWAGLETGWLDSASDSGSFTFLPGQYHVIQFRLQGIGIAERSMILKKLGVLFRGFGGWMAGSPERDVLQVGLPAARKHYREVDAVVFSPVASFTEFCHEAVSGIKSKKFHFVESPGEMALQQQTAGAMICRLDQSNMHYATALAARIPEQPLLIVSGLSSGIPSISTRVRHLQLPVDSRTLFAEIRKTLRS